MTEGLVSVVISLVWMVICTYEKHPHDQFTLYSPHDSFPYAQPNKSQPWAFWQPIIEED